MPGRPLRDRQPRLSARGHYKEPRSAARIAASASYRPRCGCSKCGRAKIIGDGELELGKVHEPWDIGLVPMPADPPLHLLLIEKADATTESGGRSPQVKAALSRLNSR